MEEQCPHRGASLALGRNEDCWLRCLHHGWKLDVERRILETPAEQSETWRHRLRHVAYPVIEAGGLVWTCLALILRPDSPYLKTGALDHASSRRVLTNHALARSAGFPTLRSDA
jgi:phenylpropionate dioxygenase-like ring-hydroxylating dioxygenase large terminal subunit